MLAAVAAQAKSTGRIRRYSALHLLSPSPQPALIALPRAVALALIGFCVPRASQMQGLANGAQQKADIVAPVDGQVRSRLAKQYAVGSYSLAVPSARFITAMLQPSAPLAKKSR